MWIYIYYIYIYIYIYIYTPEFNLSSISLKLAEKLFSKTFFMEPCLAKREDTELTFHPPLHDNFHRKTTLIFVAL